MLGPSSPLTKAPSSLRPSASQAIPSYEFVSISFSKNDQKSDWFLNVNPNGRIPALVDNREGGKPINVWESASILLYLTRVYDKVRLFLTATASPLSMATASRSAS